MKKLSSGITAPQGFTAQGICAGIKNEEKEDLAIIFSASRCTTAGVFTTNLVHAACIDINREHLRDQQAQAIIVNSGNANACTGKQGYADTLRMAQIGARALNIDPRDVLIASTGVIGVELPMERVEAGIYKAAQELSMQGSASAARAIMTTDLRIKEQAVEVVIKGKPVRLGAIAKGSGMIHPQMATMLAFITTDVCISPECLQTALHSSVGDSFNMISVDGDTSTNDMVLVMANGRANNPIIDQVDSPEYDLFVHAMQEICQHLARLIARDGEGAEHLIEVKVLHAADQNTARTIARSVSSSNLVKCAVFGADANWGRILAAAGYSGAAFDPGKVDIYLGREMMACNGQGVKFDEEKAKKELKKETVSIVLDLKSGPASATAWGCDLSYDYVKINADYRT
ncbi:MAG TPA: bifunctional glutamate N-acetyltransferase/amino-acid acetyltransferase ArgJ [Syntrophomonadaceae bacterium]|nr:bifunctional glutamate N-acetyltransferase/amino-acid acetyltransferase ArgJ [Syntrophomonadaceae bacterium]